MSRFSSEFITASTSGRIVGPAFGVDRVEKDTRLDLTGAVYVALVGERLDGHAFVREAFQKGAVAALVDETHAAALADAGTLVVVKATDRALLDLASAHLERCSARRIALTGSNGKTTTKEMIAAICRHAFGETAVHATAGNLNNLIGLPLTALGVSAADAVAVLEMGMSHPGEIAAMAAAVRPEVGLIVNVQPAHLEGLGDLAAVARAKGELFEVLGEADVAVVNQDDPHCRALAERCRASALRFGWSDEADVRIEEVVPVEEGQRIRLRLPEGRLECSIPHEGAHNAMNAAAAAACGLALGLPGDAITGGLSSAMVVGGRLERRAIGGVEIIDDTYNANPSSMEAAIALASQRATSGRLLMALGEMRELGEAAAVLHRAVGGAVARVAPAHVWFCGAFGKAYRDGALAAGLAADRVSEAADAAELLDAIADRIRAGDLILVKGSRGARMERVVERIERQLRTNVGGE